MDICKKEIMVNITYKIDYISKSGYKFYVKYYYINGQLWEVQVNGKKTSLSSLIWLFGE